MDADYAFQPNTLAIALFLYRVDNETNFKNKSWRMASGPSKFEELPVVHLLNDNL